MIEPDFLRDFNPQDGNGRNPEQRQHPLHTLATLCTPPFHRFVVEPDFLREFNPRDGSVKSPEEYARAAGKAAREAGKVCGSILFMSCSSKVA